MLKRRSALCALGLAFGAVLLQAQDVFVLPGAGSNSGSVAAFTASPLSKITTFTAGNSAFQVLPTPDGTKFYIIAASTTQTITSIDSSFLHPTVVANLSTPATTAVMTPDGKLLAVAAATLHLINTANDTEVAPGGISQGTGITTFDVAASLDASSVFALGSTGAGSTQLTAINTTTHTATATFSIPQAATAVAVGPNGLVYVSLPNEILELDPRTLKATPNGTMGVTGTPGRLVFTPDGQFALATNQSSLATSALLVVALATHKVTSPDLVLPLLTGFQTIGVDSVIGFSSQGIYQITVSNPISVNQLQVPGVAGSVLALTASNEVPAGGLGTVRNIYVVTASNIYRIDPTTNNTTGQFPLPNNIGAGALAFAAPAISAQQSRVTSLITFGSSQSILPSSTSAPLVVQVLDVNNHPIMGASVQFQSSSSSATLTPASATTGSNGYALTYLTAPATAGPVTVTAAVGTANANFHIDVSSTAGNANAPRLSIVAGQGNLMRANTGTSISSQYGSPLKVLVTDSNGNPLSGVPVTFSVPGSGGNLIANGAEGLVETVNTGAGGTAQVDFLTNSLTPNNSTGFVQTSVTVTAPGTNSVIFYVTTVDQLKYANVQFLSPAPGTTLTGAEGSTLPAAVSAQVYSPSGFPIPNVSLTLNDGDLDPNVSPTVSCNAPDGGAVLTGTNGTASCDVVFGPRIGTGTFTAFLGYTGSSFPVFFNVTAAQPGVVQITQGNNQVGNPGQKLPLALVVHVTDSGGNTVKGTAVSWQVLTAGAVTLSNVSTNTDSSGNASAVATLGASGGTAQVKVIAGTASATFNLTINVPSVGIQVVSGDQQTTSINTAFPAPLIVQVVDSANNGVPGVAVNFQVTSGDATLGSASATTDSNGQASTTVTAGPTGGSITVNATSGAFSVNFTLTAQLPHPTNITIVNGASFDANNGVSPGSIATISGTGILPGVQGLVTANNIVGALPFSLAGVSITFDGTPAPIYYVQNANGTEQVTVQVPFEVQPGPSVALTINVDSGGSTTVMVPVKPLAPGVFTTMFGDTMVPVALRPDGSFVSPTNPAQRGENINVYVTGLGQVTPATATGSAGIPGQSMLPNAKGALPMIIGLNNGGVPLISAEYAQGLVGVYVITLQVPADTATGPAQPLGVIAFDDAGNAYFAHPTYLPIQ